MRRHLTLQTKRKMEMRGDRSAGFEILTPTVVMIKFQLLRDVTPCRLVHSYEVSNDRIAFIFTVTV
jgi:hypothetical protein